MSTQHHIATLTLEPGQKVLVDKRLDSTGHSLIFKCSFPEHVRVSDLRLDELSVNLGRNGTLVYMLSSEIAFGHTMCVQRVRIALQNMHPSKAIAVTVQLGREKALDQTTVPSPRLAPLQFLDSNGDPVYLIKPGEDPIVLTVKLPQWIINLNGIFISVESQTADRPSALVEFRNLKYLDSDDLLGQDGEWLEESKLNEWNNDYYRLGTKGTMPTTVRSRKLQHRVKLTSQAPLTIECRAYGEGDSALLNLTAAIEYDSSIPLASEAD